MTRSQHKPIPFPSTQGQVKVERDTDNAIDTQRDLPSKNRGNIHAQPRVLEHEAPDAVDIKAYTQPFISFITDNPTTFHAVSAVGKRLESTGFIKLSERDSWKLERGGKYFFERNGSSVIAFVVGEEYRSGNGASVIASHIDALTTRLKPIPTLPTKAGYAQLGVAPYAGALNNTWWDRDLGIGGRVLVKDSKTGKIQTKLVKLGWPIARIPTLAPHFGAASDVTNANKETQMVPIIGLDNSDASDGTKNNERNPGLMGGAGTFAATQPERLVKAIAGEMNIKDYSTIVNWELELFDTQPAQLGGLEKEFIFAGRVDDKLCSFAAIEALIASADSDSDSSTIKLVGCFDDEEIGSLLRQGAHSNLLPSTLERICEVFSNGKCGANCVSQMYANSFLISADVSHAVNPNFMGAYLENHAPRLNTGIAIQADPNGHTTTDSVSTAFLQRVADKCNAKLQVFQIRNDSRSGGTVGPMLSSAMGMRAIDAGLPQLSMHSIRATIGSLDPGLGVQLFKGFFDYFEEVDAEFR
ncbi:aminopeptidase I, partial [Lecanoromycetidae sp. Uapishka_2]